MPTDATEKTEEVCVFHNLAALVSHRLNELNEPDGGVCAEHVEWAGYISGFEAIALYF